MEGVEDACFKHAIYQIQGRESCKWSPPPAGYVRMDVDGSVNQHQQAACGGVARDEFGIWLGGFQASLGYASSTEAELYAIREGLLMCQDKGFDKLKLFTDSLEAIQLIFSEGGLYHPLNQVIKNIYSLTLNGWDLEIIHCHREAIGCADSIVRNGHCIGPVYAYLQEPPSYCLLYLSRDVGLGLGMAFPDLSAA